MNNEIVAKYGKTSDDHFFAIVYNTYGEVLSAAGKLDTIEEVYDYFKKWNIGKESVTLVENKHE